jgi:hypothetical protein
VVLIKEVRNIKIVQISSGLGNQMFQYALYKKLSMKSDDVYLDTKSSYDVNDQHNGYELKRVFGINPNVAVDSDIDKLSDINNHFKARFRRKLFGYKKTFYKEKMEFSFDSQVMNKDNVYIKGYWQNINYFKDITEELRNDFKFIEELDQENCKIAKKILSDKQSVSIHVRRGDYYRNKQFEDKFGNIANLEYFKAAIEYLNSQISDISFYIFSDDINWVKENLGHLGDFKYIDHNRGLDSYRDMQLMSLCKHNIIANSTFSWWPAFLNSNVEKIVIAPSKWINIKELSNVELFPDEWILINK